MCFFLFFFRRFFGKFKDVLGRWADGNRHLLGPRGVASMALALSRVGCGLGGQDANAQQPL